MIYPKKRNLDGVYFRIKRQDDVYNLCFTDLTEQEQDDIMEGRSEEWLKSLCKILSNTIRTIGEYCDLYVDHGTEAE